MTRVVFWSRKEDLETKVDEFSFDSGVEVTIYGRWVKAYYRESGYANHLRIPKSVTRVSVQYK